MENASKALLMAGSVLLAMLIITALVLMYNSIIGLRQEEASSDEIQKLADYNRQIETFNEDEIYGPELLSLSNLIEDYNARQAGLKGYTAITFEVDIKDESYTATNVYIKKNNYSGSELKKAFDELEKEVKQLKLDKVTFNGKNLGKTAQEISGMRFEAKESLIAEKFGYDLRYNDQRDRVDILVDELTNNESVIRYVNLNEEMVTFRNTKFKRDSFKYDANGRVISVKFSK